MTVTNIVLSADEVSIYTDTLAYRGDQPASLTPVKANLAANGRFIVSTQGGVGRGDRYSRNLTKSDDFDMAVEVARYVMTLESEAPPIDNPDGEGFAVHIGGWSHARGRMAAVSFTNTPGAPLDEVWLLDGVTLHPAPVQERHRFRPGRWTEEQCIKIAMQQKVASDRMALNMCVGGSLWRSTVTPAGAEQRLAALYPNYEELAARFADPLADAVAEFRRQGWRAAA